MKKFLLSGLCIFISCGISMAFEPQEVNVVPINLDTSTDSSFQIRPKNDSVENVVIPLAEPEESPAEKLTAESDTPKKENIDYKSIEDEEENQEEVLTEEVKEAYTEEDFQSSEEDITLEVPVKEEKPKPVKQELKPTPETFEIIEQKPFNTIPYSNNTGSIYRF